MFKNLLATLLLTSSIAAAQRVEVSVPSKTPLHGHLILVFSKDAKSQPRMQMEEQYRSAQAFGVDTGIDGTKSA